jgi:hypothetical protein
MERPPMANTFQKLNLKDQTAILVLNAPRSLEPELADLPGVAVARLVNDVSAVQFSFAFVTKQREVHDLAKAIANKAKGDRAEFIKTMSRSPQHAISAGGKARARGK